MERLLAGDSAEDVLGRANAVDNRTCNQVISRYGRIRRKEAWRVAEQLVEMLKAAGVQPDVYTYSALISAYEKGGGQWERAEAAVAEMRAAGLQPDVITYGALFACLAGQPEHILAHLASATQDPSLAGNMLLWDGALGGLWPPTAGAGSPGAALAVETLASALSKGLAPALPVGTFLDLHDFSPGGARATVVAWLLARAREEGGGSPSPRLEVITGRGLGSEGGVPVVKPAVEQLLREVGVSFREAEGNPGALVVDTEDARRGLLAAPSDVARRLVDALRAGSDS